MSPSTASRAPSVSAQRCAIRLTGRRDSDTRRRAASTLGKFVQYRLSALVAVTVAFADRGDALTEADIENTVITDLFKGQQLTAGSSGWLVDVFSSTASSIMNRC